MRMMHIKERNGSKGCNLTELEGSERLLLVEQSCVYGRSPGSRIGCPDLVSSFHKGHV